uniref:TldD/PmbA family protein n=1 Tax=Halobacteriovorax sp. TaxID=2020862 RepID=UPI00356867D3
IQYLLKIDAAARKQSDKISQVTCGVLQRLQDIEIFNSEGLHVTDTRNYTRLMANAVATDGNEQSTGYDAPGALSGWELVDNINPVEMGELVSKQALVKLTADDCPAGKMPVVIDNGFGGVIFHEACGHLLETTSVQKKASVFWDKMEEDIAHSAVSAVDDGTMENLWGSINIDDEGMETKKTQLIKDGKLTSFLVDKVGSMKTGYDRTGSGRRQSYKYAPASRMRNTYIEAGDHSLDDILATIDNGIYCKKMGGGSVKPGTGEFNFSAQESYLIKNGKIDRPLKGATLIGTGPDVLKKISMVGNNLALAAGMCGSVSGSIPTSVGQAALKVDEILVGGKA